MQAPDQSLRSIIERGCYLIWLFYTIITFNIACAAGGILLYDACFYITLNLGWWPSSPFNYMIGVMGELLLLASINLPVCIAMRYCGVVYCRFLLHEGHYDAVGEETDAGFVGPNAHQIMEFLEQIRTAKAWDRQATRQRLRNWLEKHHGSLTASEFGYLEEHFGYGMDPNWQRPKH